MAYIDPTGDSVTNRFKGMEKNRGLKPAEVAINPAPGTRILKTRAGGPWR